MTPDLLRSTLKRHGIKQTELAAWGDISPGAVTRWIKSERSIPGWVPTLLTLIEALGVDEARRILETRK